MMIFRLHLSLKFDTAMQWVFEVAFRKSSNAVIAGIVRRFFAWQKGGEVHARNDLSRTPPMGLAKADSRDGSFYLKAQITGQDNGRTVFVLASSLMKTDKIVETEFHQNH